MFHIPALTAASSWEQGSQVSAVTDRIRDGCDTGVALGLRRWGHPGWQEHLEGAGLGAFDIYVPVR